MSVSVVRKVNEVRRSLMRNTTKFVGKSDSEAIAAINPQEVRRILIVRPNGRLGNQLLLTPLLQEIERVFPNCKVDIFIKGGLAHILYENYPSIDQLIKLPSRPFNHLWQYMKVWVSLRKHRYDIVLNAIPNSSSGRLATRLSKSNIKYYGEPENEGNQISIHKGMGPVSNFREHFRALYKKMDSWCAIEPLSLRLSSEEMEAGRRELREVTHNDKPTIMVYTFATGDKIYSKEWWAELYGDIKAQYGESHNIVEMLPKENVSQIDFDAISYYSTDLRLMAAMIANAELFITADCGIMHLASSANTPTVGLFSVTSISGYRPYNEGSVAVNTTISSINQILSAVTQILEKNAS